MTDLPTTDLSAELSALSQAYLEQARRTDFGDPALLTKASQCLMMVLEQDPQNLDAMMGLAYVSAQAGLFERALQWLMMAQVIYPDERRLHLLAREIQNLSRQLPDADLSDARLLVHLVADIDFRAIPPAILRARAEALPDLTQKGLFL